MVSLHFWHREFSKWLAVVMFSWYTTRNSILCHTRWVELRPSLSSTTPTLTRTCFRSVGPPRVPSTSSWWTQSRVTSAEITPLPSRAPSRGLLVESSSSEIRRTSRGSTRPASTSGKIYFSAYVPCWCCHLVICAKHHCASVLGLLSYVRTGWLKKSCAGNGGGNVIVIVTMLHGMYSVGLGRYQR